MKDTVKVKFDSTRRPTLEENGVSTVRLETITPAGDVLSSVTVGTINYGRNDGSYNATYTADGENQELGVFATKAQAGHAMRKLFANAGTQFEDAAEAIADATTRLVTQAEAMEILGVSKDALRKRVKRNTVVQVGDLYEVPA